MQVLLTIGLIVIAAVWVAASLRRLDKLRAEVKLVWAKLEADQSNDAIKAVYNKHVAAYNSALDGFPANVFAPLAGYKPARPF